MAQLLPLRGDDSNSFLEIIVSRILLTHKLSIRAFSSEHIEFIMLLIRGFAF